MPAEPFGSRAKKGEPLVVLVVGVEKLLEAARAREAITDRLVAIKEYLPNALAARGRDRTTVHPVSEGARGEGGYGRMFAGAAG